MRNYAKERIEDDFNPTFPSDNIICKDCEFRKRGIIGFKNAYCQIYEPDIADKPYEILFENAGCKYYLKEEKDAE